ncbi:S-layer homology domain-containing protein [Paenibacillus sp. UNC496MF]|uniref:S-layer homology domain-containing protein n=1 Tax=Paenibacillus sp. UNC496MF TaxID=1502753 RepID=UPI0008E48E32|nr:S-layer homology domain-containing protein [Paenibacillus sp. UNC496MF]SFJ70162.1 S-layer homology domain-containing protein [Paenibacillus sp. UNC496MF]
MTDAKLDAAGTKLTLTFDQPLDPAVSPVRYLSLEGTAAAVESAGYAGEAGAYRQVVATLSDAAAGDGELEVSLREDAVRGEARGIASEAVTGFPVTKEPPVTDPSGPSGPTGPSAPSGTTGLQGTAGGAAVQLATGTAGELDGRATMTAAIDDAKLAELLARAGGKPVVVLPVGGGFDRVDALLTAGGLQALAGRSGTLLLRTAIGSYALPAGEIAAALMKTLTASGASPADAKIRVTIANVGGGAASRLQAAAAKGGFEVLAPPVEFAAAIEAGGKTVPIEALGSFAKRGIRLPNGMDSSRLTTAVMLDEDGGVHAVPTSRETREGVPAAAVSSLTNGVIALIHHEAPFADTGRHWGQDAIDDLASRLVLTGGADGRFRPDDRVTRAEFAAILLRALGLRDGGTAEFGDADPSAWYAGYEDGYFRPDRAVTREEAMVMLARAAKLAGLPAPAGGAETAAALAGFKDRAALAGWAAPSAAALIRVGLVQGSAGKLRPDAAMTRAETAAIAQRLLRRAGLIDG